MKFLRRLLIGCHVAGVFYGCLVYADDVFLLAPSREGLQVLVTESEKFATKRNLKFSTHPIPAKSKTKCIIFSKRNIKIDQISPILLNNSPLPYVEKLLHLGNWLQCDNSMKIDCSVKRAKFIGKVNSLYQEFHFSTPEGKSKLVDKFCCTFYGSCLWNFYNRECDKLFKSYNVAMRIGFSIPRNSHRYFIEELTDSYHPKVLLSSRFIKFQESVLKCSKPSVRLLGHLSKMIIGQFLDPI